MNNLKKYRKREKLTQEALATLVQCNKSYICELENYNIREPGLGRARLICRHLHASLEEVFPDNKRRMK